MGVGSFLFGGKGPTNTPKLRSRFGSVGMGGIADLLGYQQTGDWSKGTKSAWNWNGYQTPVTVDSANSGFDYSGLDDAISKYKAGPTKLSYTPLADQYYTDQMALGAKDINRTGAGAIAKAQEAIGTRRPDLLFKAADNAGRATQESLASLNTNLRGQQAKEKTDLGVAEQKDNADLVSKYLEGLATTSNQKLSQQSGNYQYEKGLRSDLLKHLLSMYMSSRPSEAKGGSGGGGLFGTVANLAGTAAKAYAGGA